MKCTRVPLLLLLFVAGIFRPHTAGAQKQDSITIAIAPEYDSVSKAHRFLFGESYRKLWAARVKVRVIHLKSEKGGMTITEKGGGLQTKSLKLKDAAGNEWVLRSIQKYPERALPPRLKATIAKDILQDQVVTGHPFAALTVPPFAAALGILHSNPEVVYMPDDPLLGKYRKDFANSVLLLEEKDPLTIGDADNTEKVEKKMAEDNDVRVDQKMVLRARLLDIFLGDWDRHEGQWRWGEKKTGSGTIYLPIPRDRDKVYYNTSGVLPKVLSHQHLKTNLQGFHDEIRDIAGYNYNNRYFDRIFLNELSEDDWKEQIAYVQSVLTDKLIRTAVRRLPEPVYALSAKNIINTLIARRAMLPKEALKYFRFISLRVDVTASDKQELFNINSRDNGDVAVSIYKTNDKGAVKKAIYNRVFDHHFTKEIRLYGFGGNDIFSVTGTQKSPIKVRMIGGDDVDSFHVDKHLQNRRKLYVYDRSDQPNIFPSKSLARIKTKVDSSVNEYDPHSFKYDKLGPVFSTVYTVDQGAMLRVGIGYEKHGFRKEPFAEKHMVSANFGTSRRSFMFEYSGYLTKVIKNNDLSIDLVSKGPRNVTNFFGIGNETKYINTGGGIDYYRNRYDLLSADVRLHRSLSQSVTINAGVLAQYYTSSAAHNTTHFFGKYNQTNPGLDLFSKRSYAGIAAAAIVDTRNDGLFSSRGILWNTEITALNRLNADRKSSASIFSEINFYLPISSDSNFVLANRVGAGTTVGDPAFYQQMQLGGVRNLRGFHTFRFTGKSMFFHNVDLRCKLFDFTSYLFPGTIGIIAFNDVGRVWVPGEASSKWHDGYGGGIYIVPAELILIQAAVGHSVEGTMPYISLGFSF